MFNDGVRLSKGGWYIGLMDFMWGASWRDFPNLCPLFWGVIGSIIIFPIWLIIKMIAAVFSFEIETKWGTFGRVISWIGMAFLALTFLGFWAGAILTIGVNTLISAIVVGGSWKILIHVLTILLYLVVFGVLLWAIYRYRRAISGWKEHKIYGNKRYQEFEEKILGNWLVQLPYNLLEWAAKPVVWFLGLIWSGIVFICKFIHSVYKKSCPLITWED